MQMKSHLGIHDYVIFTFEKNQGFRNTLNLWIRTINTHPSDPFKTFSTYLVMLPGNGKSDTSVTVVDITSTCNVFLLNILSL